MAEPTIVQNIKTYFTSDFYKIAAEKLDERKYDIEKALSAIIPLILGALLNKATSNNENCQSVYDVCLEESTKFSVDFDFSKLVPGVTGSSLYLLKDKKEMLESEISRYADIKTTSASGLISMAIPSILALTGKHAERNQLSPSGLAGYLSSQEYFIARDIHATLAPFEIHFELAPIKKSNVQHWDYSFKKFSSSNRYAKRWVIAIALLIVATLFFLYVKR